MARPQKNVEQRHDEPAQAGTGPAPGEEPLGDQLLREAREGDAEFALGWRKFMEELGIRGKPIGAKNLRATLLQSGINPNDNEFSRDIITAREE